MSSIIPAILPISREDLEHKAGLLVDLVDVVQIDLVDGVFANPPSWPYASPDSGGFAPYTDENPMPNLGRLKYELDLMLGEPEKVVGDWIAGGVERLVFHAESSRFLLETMQDVNMRYGHDKDFAPDLLSLGVALNVESDIALLDPFLQYAEYVQFMGIADIGKQGQPFDQRVLRKIADFRSKHPEVLIQVDGGVSLETARALLFAGVDRLVIGSALWKAPDFKESLEQFMDIVREHNG